MAKFVARYRQFTVRLEVNDGVPMDTPEHRERLYRKLGEMLVQAIKNNVRFSNE